MNTKTIEVVDFWDKMYGSKKSLWRDLLFNSLRYALKQKSGNASSDVKIQVSVAHIK